MKNAMQLKAIVKNIAKEKNIKAQEVLDIYLLERLLERISQSKYSNYFILKGGFLIASIVGVDNRTTMDIDATIKSYPVNNQSISSMFGEICKISLDDNVEFSLNYVEPIRETDEYEGLRVHLKASFPPLNEDLKLDITTGDKVTPKEILYRYPKILEEGYIPIYSYNIETILAEKLETVISRSIANTRARDYYDIYRIYNLYQEKIDFSVLKKALHFTAKKRNSLSIMENYQQICRTIANDKNMHDLWVKYQNQFSYARDISFDDCIKTVIDLLLVAKDDELGRKLQDLKLTTRKRASKVKRD